MPCVQVWYPAVKNAKISPKDGICYCDAVFEGAPLRGSCHRTCSEYGVVGDGTADCPDAFAESRGDPAACPDPFAQSGGDPAACPEAWRSFAFAIPTAASRGRANQPVPWPQQSSRHFFGLLIKKALTAAACRGRASSVSRGLNTVDDDSSKVCSAAVRHKPDSASRDPARCCQRDEGKTAVAYPTDGHEGLVGNPSTFKGKEKVVVLDSEEEEDASLRADACEGFIGNYSTVKGKEKNVVLDSEDEEDVALGVEFISLLTRRGVTTIAS
ncbi:hypothetical protein GOP47_0010195 [Adiantum capillus-veneris]|uniref:Uncharacterized protein n=1 Tax=Adiantum capillus-veneris TaxID=13818 RepID=A0A9D4UUT4_ADICA|nr:hypothetical protein GOP47_0010195 [Adiantum capillus-veneris]